MARSYIPITRQNLKRIMPHASDKNIRKYLPYLNEVMQLFEIDTTIRQCHFLAQLAVESGSLAYVLEIASGEAYEGREDLGNIHRGDGPKYKGRGLMQLTGRSNYERFQDWLNLNLSTSYTILLRPELLEEPYLACLVAGWYWQVRDINVAADHDNVVVVTKLVNGGRNGLQDRINFLNAAKIELGWL